MEVLPVFSKITLGSSDVKYKTADTITVPAVLRISIYTHFYGLIISFLYIWCKWNSKTFFDSSQLLITSMCQFLSTCLIIGFTPMERR